jgi:hypothetical protein
MDPGIRFRRSVPLRPRPRADGALMRGGDGTDDGQAQAHAAAVVGAVSAEPAERLEQGRDVLRRDVLAGVADGERGLVRDRYFYLYPAARLVVDDRVRHQVRDEPLQQDGVAGDQALAQLPVQRDPVLGSQLFVRVEHGFRQLVQPHRDPARQATVAFRENQQPLDQPLVPVIRAQQLSAEPAQLLARARVLHRHFRQHPLDRQRGTQLMRGVRREPALALIPGRQPVQRAVEHVGQLLERVGPRAQLRLREYLSGVLDSECDNHRVARDRLEDLEVQNSKDLDRLSGGAIINANGSQVHIAKARTARLTLNASNKAQIHVADYQSSDEPERVPLTGSLPEGVALQPASTDVWTIRRGSARNPFFIPARYNLQLTVIYGMSKPQEERQDQDLHSNTTSFTVPVRAALWSVITGAVVGGVTGSLSRSLQESHTLNGILGAHAASTVGALALAVLLSGAAVIFAARKAEAQSFITVEDFWGGVLVGFLIGYSGTAAFTKITGVKL